jgi:DNA-binding transcriptional regulator YdaS (Cro superfamily)
MHLKQYIDEGRGRASILAKAIGVSPSYLSQMASGDAAISPIKSVEIEFATNKQVTRQDLRPNDWRAIWPELAAQEPRSESAGVITST